MHINPIPLTSIDAAAAYAHAHAHDVVDMYDSMWLNVPVDTWMMLNVVYMSLIKLTKIMNMYYEYDFQSYQYMNQQESTRVNMIEQMNKWMKLEEWHIHTEMEQMLEGK